MFNDDFVEFMAFRDNVVQNKVDECLDLLNMGYELDDIDMDDLSDDEIDELRKEIRRRRCEEEW